jgi:hypothetical protein
MQNYTFHEGEEVRHFHNLEQKMIVSQIKRKTKKIPKPDGKTTIDPSTGKEVFEKIDKVFFEGIECTWWDKEGKFHKEVFHTKWLIPKHFATSGSTGEINMMSVGAFFGTKP